MFCCIGESDDVPFVSECAEGAQLVGHGFFCVTNLLALACVLVRLRRCLFGLPMSPIVGRRERRSDPLRTWLPPA